LDPERTSPYQFYQFWLNASDTDAENWIKIFTFLDESTINDLIGQHHADPSKRVLQKALAKEITTFVHGKEEYEKALATTEKLFANQTKPAEEMTIEDLEGMEGIVKSTIEREKVNAGIDIVSLLAETKITSSKGEARKLIQGGGIQLNRRKIDDVQFVVDSVRLLHDKYLLLQKGKKNYFLVEAV
jgi:Tyrosyl-tRNA synthetase